MIGKSQSEGVTTINSLASWLTERGLKGYFTGGDSYLRWETFPGAKLRVSICVDSRGLVWSHGSPRTGVTGINPIELMAQVEFSLKMYYCAECNAL